MAAGIWVVARTAAATVGDANGVAANRVVWQLAVSHWEVGVRVAWRSVVSLGVVGYRVDAGLAHAMRKEVCRVGVWLVSAAGWVCTQVWLRAGFSLQWAVWRVRA
jgi:hypothetical protein